MGQSQLGGTELAVHVRNLGGIEESTVRLHQGVNVLSGRNATNRTSFLRALIGALGSDGVSLKADADSGTVTLETPTTSYSRRLERTDGQVVDSGAPYLDDPTVADLFAFLLESNEARRAVSRGDDLRELIMRPVDIEAISAEIEAKSTEKRRLDSRIETLHDLEAEQAELEAEQAELDAAVEETVAELETKRAELDAMDGSVEATQAEKQELDNTLEELQSVQSELESVRYRRETERESVDTLREERDEIEAELNELTETSGADRRALESKLDERRQRRSELDSTASQLQSVIQFNEEIVEGTTPAITKALRGSDASDALTDQLLSDGESVVCWTCGSQVEQERVESTLERLKNLRQETVSERRELRTEIDDLTERKQELERVSQRREQLQAQLEQTDTELDTRTERIDSLSMELKSLRKQASDLEADIENHEHSTNSAILDQHTEINQLEFELGRLESQREQLADRIESVDAKLDERKRLKRDREKLQEQLTELRTQVDQLEAESVEAFNQHIEAVLEALDYGNLERIWIERTTRNVKQGRHSVEQSAFELHIVRSTDDDRVYEDTIDHLSESEREVTGLVFALAGYLVHEVHEIVPFMLLDSLEAIDSERIATLVDYLSDYVDTIVVALLPEDAQALDDNYHRVTEI